METNINFFNQSVLPDHSEDILRLARKVRELSQQRSSELPPLDFKKISPADMPDIWHYLRKEKGRTTDFSYAGVLMWIDYFNYEFAIVNDTLFIKGCVENDLSKTAFSLPVGSMPLEQSVGMLKDYCSRHGMDLEFSAVPEYALEGFRRLSPVMVEELSDWGDYLYEATPLATLKGRKMGKKRNHVNRFMANFPDWNAVEMTPENAREALLFMDVFDLEGDSSDMAVAERQLSRNLIRLMAAGDNVMKGMILYAGGKVCAYTIGDIKGDTLFIHVEKATRAVSGSYEMINYLFAKEIMEENPDVRYINREDDSGDIGLRMAKESYHPLCILKKYNVCF